MSEQILKALMQLFAIIARPESNASDRQTVVESFLKRQLNQELVQEYLKVFVEYYSIHQDKQKKTEKLNKLMAKINVRVLKICTEINEELTQQQKIIVLMQLLEFVKSDDYEITEQELEFISMVAEIFHLKEEYEQINEFVLYSFDQIPNSNRVLVIDNNKEYSYPKTKHIYSEFLEGQLRVLNVTVANMYFIRYIGEKEIYLNGQLLQQDKVYVFNTGSSVKNPQIKPIYYSDVISYFREGELESKIIYDVHKIEYKFKRGEIGLHDISFSEESGKLVGIMGSSGAGKSTLVNVLNGSCNPSAGEVLINGVNIHDEKNKIEGIIGFVSQDDLLIEELTVFQNLYYNAKLCFDNYDEAHITETVNKTLRNLGLFEIKDIMVGNPLNKKISGGQRKRLNIALELIREPSVLFMDEPTSGLSSRDSENILDLLKDLTSKGKLIFVVIHQPSSEIFKMFDKLLILDTGGYLIYNGNPIDSIVYFKSCIHHANWNESECHICGNVNPEQIFNIVDSNVLDEYGKITRTRKISPKEWNDYYKDFFKVSDEKTELVNKIPEISFKIPNKFKQFFVFLKRNILAKLADTQYLFVSLLEAPVLAFFLAFLIRYYNVSVTNEFGYTLMENSNLPVYIFMSVIVALFMGLTLSAEEIIKDRKILKREAFLNLSWSSYLLSKIAVLFIISAIQALTFVTLGNSIIEIKGMYFQYWIILFSAWASSNLMGLIISDSFKTVVTIYFCIPFLVIPQIILSGILVKFEKLNPAISSPNSIPFYGEIITARWGYEALAVYQFMENDFEKQFYPYDKIESFANYKKNYWVVNLDNKINNCQRNIDNPEKEKQIQSDLALLRNEIKNELEINKKIPFEYIDSLYYHKLNPEIFNATKYYINFLKEYYKQLSKKTNIEKDKIISSFQKTPEDKEKFLETKRNHTNENLRDLVRNSSETEKIVEYKNHLYQKSDPIYLDPDHNLIKAHFYAPTKKFLGNYYSTFWINTIVIWFMTICLYIILYYRLLKKFLDSFELVSEKFRKKQEK